MPKRPERPNYGELDVGVVKQLAISDKECKKTQEGFQLARTRLAVLEAEEARLAVQLRKAEIQQQAFDNKRQMQEIRDRDRRRKNETASRERIVKEDHRNQERDRKERARDRMEDLYHSKRNDILKEREDWNKMKSVFEEETRHYQEKLGDLNREDRATTKGRRQKLQDDFDTRLVQRTEERVTERRRNEDFLRERKEQQVKLLSETAREQREAAKSMQQMHFENMVRGKKRTVLADAGRKLATRKAVCNDIVKETQEVEMREMKARQRLEIQRQHLRDVGTPVCAAPTPRMIR